jgi:predicted Na+-dependent transporter
VYAFAAPIVVLCALGHPAGALGGTVSAMLRMVAEVAGAVIVPLLAGMSIRRRYPRVSALTETPLRTIAALLVVVVFGWFGYEHLHSFESAGLRILGAVVLLNSAGWFMAALLTLRFRLSKREFIAVGVEHSIRQEGVGVFVAISVMGMPQIVPPLIVNSLVGLLVSFIVNAAIAARMRERRAARPPSPLFIEPD